VPMPQPGVDFDPAEDPPAGEAHPMLAKAKALFGATTTQWGLDYAWESDTPAQLAALLAVNHAEFVCRYVNDAGGKGITTAEVTALEAKGIIIGAIYETTGTDFTGGYNAGLTAGRNSLADMRARGAPAGSYCWYAIDTDTSDFTSTNNYLRGAKAGSGTYIAQLYGSYKVVEAAYAAGLGDKHWQTYAWSRGQLSSHAALYQYQNGVMIGGISMDRDRSLTHMSGPWAHFTTTPPPPPPGTFPAPANLTASKPKVAVALSWSPVTLNGKPPASYTVVAVGLDGKEYARASTPTTQYVMDNLNNGWTYKIRVWANGGPSAPPHAEITVKL